MTLFKKEWKLVMMPVPLLFLLLSGLVLIPNYPYYVTFFYTTLGIFLMMQSARENRDLYYMALLPVTKREMVKARFSLVLTIEAMQVLICLPFLLLRASYGEIKNAVGMEANIAFLPIEKTKNVKNIMILPKGRAVSIYHYGTYQSVDYSYKKLLDYCKEQNLNIISDSYEFCINDYISSGDEREYITEIFFYVR